MSHPAHPHDPEPTPVPDPGRPPALAALIQEAEALHAALADARTRTARLVAALRRHRKRTKWMASAVATLRQLKLPEGELVE